jgi:hypothetical protein
MNNKKIFITITIFVLLLIAGYLYWHFFIELKVENNKPLTDNNEPKIVILTAKQEAEILSRPSDVPPVILTEKQITQILNQKATNTKPVILTEEEIQKILNKTN